MQLTEKHVAAVLVSECRLCGHWLTQHRTGDSPDKRPVFYCVQDGCTRCTEAAPVRFGSLMLGQPATTR